MRFEHEGMSLWYGTSDAPAPGETVPAGAEVTITVGVQPPDASNKVEVLYCVNQGPIQTVAAQWLRSHAVSNSQYFKARIPAFAAGDTVEYAVICRCAGRQVPAMEQAKQFAASFRVVELGKELNAASKNQLGRSNAERVGVAISGKVDTMEATPVSALKQPVDSSAPDTPLFAANTGGAIRNAFSGLTGIPPDKLAQPTIGTGAEISTEEPPVISPSYDPRLNTLYAILGVMDTQDTVRTKFLAAKSDWTTSVLRQTFKYEGNASTAPFKTVKLNFEIPTFEFTIKRKPDQTSFINRTQPLFIERNEIGVQSINIFQSLAENKYFAIVPNEFLIGATENSVMNFWLYLYYIGIISNEPDILDFLSLQYTLRISDELENLFGLITMEALYSMATSSDKYRNISERLKALNTGVSLNAEATKKLALELLDYIKENIFLLNKNVFKEIAVRFKAFAPGLNDYAFLNIVSHLTDLSTRKPVFKIAVEEFKAFLITQYGTDQPGIVSAITQLVKDNFNRLFDFPVTIPEIKAMDIKGTFKIVTSDNSSVAFSVLNFYDLTVEYAIEIPGSGLHPVSFNFEWNSLSASELNDNTVPFAFAPVITNLIQSPVYVSVKGYDGSLLWENEFATTNPNLQELKIEVPLLKPVVISPSDETQPAGGNKKLHGKVVEMSGNCKLKGLIVLIQAQKANDAIGKVVGVATTDGAGNFSMPYPYGNYAAAQALVSLTPDSPADIAINSDADHVALNETIAADFLYLLLKDADCKPKSKDDDCDCHEPKKSKRLPGQEELINSADYMQDIGGTCINLTTPNRALREYSHQAIVRTSDPDVANYTLNKEKTSYNRQQEEITVFNLSGGQAKVHRRPVDLGNPIFWQDAPDNHENLSIYQAVTVATGHLLHYKTVMKADGYSMGDLLYSLPLAPGQKKQIVIFDQTHTLQASETQGISQSESLASSLVNERSIMDKLSGSIRESIKGQSSATTSGVSAGTGAAGSYGGFISGVIGISGGISNANSSASQNSSRDIAQSFNETLRNAITQNAQSYREMNASVVTTVKEGQQYAVTTEVVANHNHCHALTMMYFEVLRHYAIYQELSSVEECLFVPLLMTNFSTENIYKWRDILSVNLLPMPSETYLQPDKKVGIGLEHPLIKAFDANDRIKTNYENLDFPAGAYDEEVIRFITGEIFIRTNLPRPKSVYDRIKSWPIVKNEGSGWSWTGALLGTILAGPLAGVAGGILNGDGSIKIEATQIADKYIEINADFASHPPAQSIRVKLFDKNFFGEDSIDRDLWTAYAKLLPNFQGDVTKILSAYFKDRYISEWDNIFYNEIVPAVFERIVDNLNIATIVGSNNSPLSSIDFSSVKRYKGGESIMQINLRGDGSTKKRNEIEKLLFSFNNSAGLTRDLITLFIQNVNIRYSTSHYNGVLYSGYVGDDIIHQGTNLFTPETPNEKRNPRKEDQLIVRKLIEHLNSNLEYYNRVLWLNLDADRRFMLLDGFNIQTSDMFGQPSFFRSLASVVKNELITIVGNSLVMPVAPGYKVDRLLIAAQPMNVEGTLEEAKPVDLFEHYKSLTPTPPYRISVPTRGVYAEAVQGACDACEKVKKDTSQDWDKFKTDEPTAINPVTTPVPTVTDWKAAFKDFAAPMVNIQNAPAAPAPGAGLAGLSDLLGKSDVFKDVTGLDQNQKNALQTYLSNQQNAKDFAQMAKDIFTMGNNTEHSDKIADGIRNSPELSKEEKAKLLKDHFSQMIDGGQSKKAEQEKENQSQPSLTGAAVKAADQGRNVKATKTDADGNAESVDISGAGSAKVLATVEGNLPKLKQDNENSCWATAATIMMNWKKGKPLTVEEVLTEAGDAYLQKFNNKLSLKSSEKEAFIAKLDMIGEAPASYPLQQYIDWIKTYGPLWITTDSSDAEGVFSPHARILFKIIGAGTPDGADTDFIFIDPATGTEQKESFENFLKKYEQMVTDNSGGLFIQIVHFKDALAGEGVWGGAVPPAAPAPAVLPTRLDGIDAHFADSLPSWDDLKDMGIRFIILRSTESVGLNDDNNPGRGIKVVPVAKQYRTRHDAAHTAGIFVGAYHFYHAGQPAADQADNMAGTVRRLLPGDLPPSFDIEHKGTQDEVAWRGAEWLAPIQEFLDRIETRLGRTPMIYTSKTVWDGLGLNLPAFDAIKDYPLWVKDYPFLNPETTYTNRLTRQPVLPSSWTDWLVWQYGGDYTPVGFPKLRLVNQKMDMNVCNGTVHQLRGRADLGRPALFSGSQRNVAYTEPDGTLKLLSLPFGGWIELTLLKPLPNASTAADFPAGDVAACEVGTSQFFAFRGRTNGHIFEVERPLNGTPFQPIDISGANAVSDPFYFVDGNTRHLVYWGDDDHQHVLSNVGGLWQPTDFTADANLPSASGNAICYMEGGNLHLVGRAGNDGHLWAAFKDNGIWNSPDLTARIPVPLQPPPFLPPAATYQPSVYLGTDNTARIVYRALHGEIHQIRLLANGQAQDENLTQVTGAPTCAGNPAAFIVNGEAHIVYRRTNGQIHEIYEVPQNPIIQVGVGWEHGDLTCMEIAAADPSVLVSGAEAYVVFRTPDGTFREVKLAANNWSCQEIKPVKNLASTDESAGGSSTDPVMA